jgi:predicted nucleotidyltransferase
MTSIETTIINKFKSLISRRLSRYSLILFGSRARGDADEQSDMDVLVIVEQKEDYELLMFVYDCAYEAGLEHNVLLNVVVVSRDRWENSPERSSLLAEAVRRDGIEV